MSSPRLGLNKLLLFTVLVAVLVPATGAHAQVGPTALYLDRPVPAVFNGPGEFVSAPHFPSPAYVGAKQMTLSAWIKPSDEAWHLGPGPTGYILTWTQLGTPFLSLVIIDGKLDLTERTPSGANHQQDPVTGTLDTCVWSHVAITYDNGALLLYINGVLDTATSITLTNPVTFYTFLSIGANFRGGIPQIPHDGLIQEVSIWSKALDAAAVAGLTDGIEATDPDYAFLEAYWKMDDGVGQQVADSSGNGRHANRGRSTSPDAEDPTWTTATRAVCDLPPTADAGPDQSIRAGDMVFLDGTASFDDNTASAALDSAWTFFSLPGGSGATLANDDTATPSFLADVVGTYVVELVVTDEGGNASAPDHVEISSDNLAPTAAAGDDELVIVGSGVVLNGSGSSDPEMDTLTFSWTITSAPLGSTATISNPDMEMAGLTPDLEGVYEISLAVSDFIGPGAPDTVVITATTAEDFAENRIMCAADIVSGLVPDQVTTKGNQNAFLKHLSQAVTAIQEGDIAKAIDKLEKSIERTDGCEANGIPDGNGPGRDWITDCDAQAQILACLGEALEALRP